MEEEGMIRGRMKPWIKIYEYNYKNELKKKEWQKGNMNKR